MRMRKLHNEELYNFYLFPNIIRQIKSTRMKWAGHMTRMGEERVYKVLVGESEGKRLLGIPRHRWGIEIRMDLRDIGWGRICFRWLRLGTCGWLF
jgi:hypothetical protein